MDDRGCQATNEDLCKGALRHYEELSSECHSWYSSIPRAIIYWYLERPALEAELDRLRPAKHEVAALLKPMTAKGTCEQT